MLAIVGEVVRQVALITIMAAFLEMLLPERKLARYVRLVLGLFVVVAILTPIVRGLGAGSALDIVAWDLRLAPVATTSLQEGLELAEENERAALELYRERLASQIKALVTLVPEVKTAEVLVDVSGDQGYRGTIKRVVVVASLVDNEEPGEGGIGPSSEVEKDEIGAGAETGDERGIWSGENVLPGGDGVQADQGKVEVERTPSATEGFFRDDGSGPEDPDIIPDPAAKSTTGRAKVSAAKIEQIKARIIDMISHFYSLTPGMVEVQLLI